MDSKLNYKRIVIKIGSSSLTHAETGRLNLAKMSILRENCVICAIREWMSVW